MDEACTTVASDSTPKPPVLDISSVPLITRLGDPGDPSLHVSSASPPTPHDVIVPSPLPRIPLIQYSHVPSSNLQDSSLLDTKVSRLNSCP